MSAAARIAVPAALIALTALVAALLGGTAPSTADLLGDQQALHEAVEEVEELSAPFDTMFTRQLQGSDPGIDLTAAYQAGVAQAAALAGAAFAEAPELAGVRWRAEGPDDIGGRVLDIAPDPTTPGRIFIAAASGGVWVSDDYGGPLGAKRPGGPDTVEVFREAWPRELPQAIGALAIDRDGVLWAGTGESGPGGGSLSYGGSGVYRSSDAGRTWDFVGLGGTSRIGRIAIDPEDPDRVFVAASGPLFRPDAENRGLFLTTDGGRTWDKVLEGDNATTGIVDVSIDPDDPSVVFAAAWDHQRTPDVRRYNGIGSGLYRSTDGGTTWQRVAVGQLGPRPDMGRIGVAAAAGSDVVYATASGESGAYAGAYRSADGGATWTPIAHPLVAQNNMVYGWWFGRIYVDPANANRVWHLGLNLYLSEDGGVNWAAAGAGTAVTGGDAHADQHAMAFDPHVPGRVYLGNDGGVYVNDNNGRGNTGVWNFAEVQPFSQLYSMDVSQQFPDRHVAGLQDNGVNRNYRPNPDGPGGFAVGAGGNGDPATGWNSILGGDGERATISPANPLIVYKCFQYGECTVSSTGGSGGSSFTNEVVSSRKNWLTPIELDPFTPNVAYTGGELMSVSRDNGQNWSLVAPQDFSNGPGRETNPLFRNYGTLTTIAPAGNTVYAGTDDGNLWYSHDAGRTWTKATDPDLPTAWVTRVEVNPRNPQEAYVTYSGFRQGVDAAYVLRTLDGGRSWRNISSDLPRVPLNDVNVIGDLLVVASDVGVFATTGHRGDRVRWAPVGRDLPQVPVHELRWHEDTRTLYAATFGRGIWRAQLPTAVSNASTHAGTWLGPRAQWPGQPAGVSAAEALTAVAAVGE
jgi:photosystem II stability/assembly factor-like uncharacterized protein